MENFVLLQPEAFLQKHRQLLKEEIQEALKGVNSSNNQEDVLQTKDVCKLLNKSRQTIENWCEAGILNKRYLGESVFFLRSEILAAMREYKSEKKKI
ncbi:helix-turn-helix domain-containing protein [Marinilabilia sp.]|uniref:helix-turn-helix domain-containing protein n=1 Tax=Marinilabilia sp. TaxID=2021252 RepID=UPI0025BDC669|nr:helix-turn-helix domain-containing protein [Marinilabilia sp.]